jgi:hypothetical protein
VKWAHLLSPNQTHEIVMDSESDEAEYNASGTEDEEVEPRPPSRSPSSRNPPCYAVRIFTAFLRHSEQCLLPSPQNAVYFIHLSQLVLEILTFL